MKFNILTSDASTLARRGVVSTGHGDFETPAFMPVGTRGSVKGVSPDELISVGAEIILGNTYHLQLKPSSELIEKAGGLHRFMAWPHPILTDSGGFQVFSLAKLRKITRKGVEFSSHIDGSRLFIGPEESMGIQRRLASDIAMAFDECTPFPCTRGEAEKSVDLTYEWEARSRQSPLNSGQALFGIVQGSVFRDLREKSASDLVRLGFEGHAIGGLSVGEPEAAMLDCLDWVCPILPSDKPRYLMGVGEPSQIVEAVARGIDMFDCVLPTRLARHGSAYLSDGTTLPVKAGRYKEDFGPVEPGCSCAVCARFSRAYIRHLLNVGEMLGLRLLTIHNLHSHLSLMRQIRDSISNGTFHDLLDKFRGGSDSKESPF